MQPGTSPEENNPQGFQPAPPPPPGGVPNQGQQNGLGLAGMITGIASIVLGLCLAFLGVIGGAVAIVLGVLGLKKVNAGEANNRGMALAGIICGAIGAVIGILNAIAGIALMAATS